MLCVSQIFSVAFKILNCQHVGSKLVHFYFGQEECHYSSSTYLLTVFVVVAVVVSFGIMFIVLSRQSQDHRDDPDYSLNALCKYYKPQFYYWEFVILLRRIAISLFAIFWTFPWFPIVLVTLLLFYMVLHHKLQPFLTKEANIMESMSMSCLIIVIFIQTASSYIDSMRTAAATVLALFIIIPIIVLGIYALFMMYRIHKDPNHYDLRKQQSVIASPTNQKSAISLPGQTSQSNVQMITPTPGVARLSIQNLKNHKEIY